MIEVVENVRLKGIFIKKMLYDIDQFRIFTIMNALDK